MAEEMDKKSCSKCGKLMNIDNFYTYRDGRRTDLCKKCLTMHIDNFDENTYLWLLEELDVPYIPSQWNTLRDRAFSKHKVLNGMSVFGRYLSVMRIRQYKDYGWEDSEKLQAELEEKNPHSKKAIQDQEAQIKEAYERGDIGEAQYKTLTSTLTQMEEEKNAAMQAPAPTTPSFFPEEDLPDYTKELTDDDKIYLAMKWGRTYSPAEWIQLEKDYNNMLESFPDSTDADSLNTLILICKTNLKMNQAIDCGDMETYKKLSTAYNSMRKSSKFTAEQNKEKKEDFVDSVGKLVYYCEKWGGQIPRYDLNVERDIADTVIRDQKEYLKSLIYGDTALAQEIEDYIKKERTALTLQIDKLKAKLKSQDVELSDEDMQDYFEEISNMSAEDEKVKNGGADVEV